MCSLLHAGSRRAPARGWLRRALSDPPASDGRPGWRHAALHEQHVTVPSRVRGAYSHASPPLQHETGRRGDGYASPSGALARLQRPSIPRQQHLGCLGSPRAGRIERERWPGFGIPVSNDRIDNGPGEASSPPAMRPRAAVTVCARGPMRGRAGCRRGAPRGTTPGARPYG